MRHGALLAVILVACGTTTEVASGSNSSPSASLAAPSTGAPSATASPSPSRLPGSTVHISANGVDVQPGFSIQPPRGVPLVVTLSFPFDMNRSSVERFVPRDALPVWSDDRTLTLTIAEGSTGFKLVELTSKDGRSVIDFVVVNLAQPQSVAVNVYTIGDLIAGGAAPATGPPVQPKPSITHRITAEDHRPPFLYGAALSADARSMLEYATSVVRVPYGVRIVDIATDAPRDLVSPAAADGPFLTGQWLPDGRIVVVGKTVWVGRADGTALRAVVDLNGPDGPPGSALVSPDGRSLALSWADRVMVLDITTGILAALPTVFRPCDQATHAVLAWSLDAKRLAGSECPTGQRVDGWRVKIVDVPSGHVVTTLGFGAYSLSTFPTGELLAVTDSAISGEGAPLLGIVMGFDGVEHQRYLGANWSVSPDARYLLQAEPTGGAGSSLGTIYTLIDQKTSDRYRLFLPWTVGWLPDGRLAGL